MVWHLEGDEDSQGLDQRKELSEKANAFQQNRALGKRGIIKEISGPGTPDATGSPHLGPSPGRNVSASSPTMW